MDWKAIGEVSLKYGVEYAAVEQDTCERNPFDCLKTSFDNIKKWDFAQYNLFIRL